MHIIVFMMLRNPSLLCHMYVHTLNLTHAYHAFTTGQITVAHILDTPANGPVYMESEKLECHVEYDYEQYRICFCCLFIKYKQLPTLVCVL